MITRRQAILALALAPAAGLAYTQEVQEPAQPLPKDQPKPELTDPGITSWSSDNLVTVQPLIQRPYLQITLTKDPKDPTDYGIDRIVIVYGADKVEIAAKDIWLALQPPKVTPDGVYGFPSTPYRPL